VALPYYVHMLKLNRFGRLYRGIEAPILMEAPKRATKFAANDAWGKFYRDIFGMAKMNQSLSILTGATAGATESFVVVPFELIKIRLQDRASAGKYTGMIDCVVKTVKAEGPLALYNGLESTMWRHILWNAGYFGCIFQVRELLVALLVLCSIRPWTLSSLAFKTARKLPDQFRSITGHFQQLQLYSRRKASALYTRGSYQKS
jgi:hypothetical protein